MKATASEQLVYMNEIDPCDRCGAWRWHLSSVNVFLLHCGECAHEIPLYRAIFPPIGMD